MLKKRLGREQASDSTVLAAVVVDDIERSSDAAAPTSATETKDVKGRVDSGQ